MRLEATTDRITLEIIQSSLQAASDEMFAAFRKTAMSAIIYEVLDMGTGITDGDGNLASSGAGIPAFVGVLDKAVKRIIELNADIRPGVEHLVDDRAHGGPAQRGEHLVARRLQAALDDLQRDRIDGPRWPRRSRNRPHAGAHTSSP